MRSARTQSSLSLKITTAAAILMLLGGCQLAPRDERPPSPTADHYPDYAGDTNAGQPATTVGWRQFFADERLKALIARALERNRDLNIAVAQIEEARGLYRIQRADRLPTIGLSGDAARTRAGAASLAATGTTLPVGVDGITTEQYSIGVGVSAFELDFWGRIRNLSDAARAEYLATVEASRSFRLSLIRDVALAYITSRELDERIALAEATVTSRNDGVRLARRRLEAGVTSALDFRQAETLMTQAETELAGLRLTKAQNDNIVSILIGGPYGAPLPQGLPLAKQAGSEAFAAGIPSMLLTTRPDILAAEARLRAARANIGAARAAFFPSISLTGSFGYASQELDSLISNDGLTWSFGPTINLPIFDAGRRRGNLDVAKAREHIAVASYERSILTGFQEVSNALAGRRFLAEQVDAQQRATQAQRRIADLARIRYREGVDDYLQVLDAERNWFAAEQALLQIRSTEAANLVTLYVSLGGGVIE